MKETEENLIGHQNCITLILTNILHSEIDDYRKVWKQLGLMTYEENGSLRFYPRYRSLKKELVEGNNISLEEQTSDSKEKFKVMLNNLLGQHRIVVPVDIYYLHYSMNYQQKHEFHYIEICKMPVEGNYEVFDPMFRYRGPFSEDLLHKVIVSGKKIETDNKQENLSLLYLDVEKYQQLDRDYLYKIIDQNVKAMDVNNQEKQKDLYTNALPSNIPLNTGLSVFSDIVSILEDSIYMKDAELLEGLFLDFKEISNSRYVYSSFLEAYQNEDYFGKSFNDLSEIYYDLGHQWSVITNMILKLMVSKNDSIVPRILNKLKSLQVKETKVIEELNTISKGRLV